MQRLDVESPRTLSCRPNADTAPTPFVRAAFYNVGLPMVLARFRRWVQPPRQLWLLLAGLTVGSAAALCWLGWEMLRQEQAAEDQRARERLQLAADRAVQAFDRLLAGADAYLARVAQGPAGPADGAIASPGGGIVVHMTRAGVEPSAGRRLLFQPVVSTRPEPPETLFAEGEAAEYGGQVRRAADLYRVLARSSAVPTVRAAALLRLARTLRNGAQQDAALDVYAELESLGDTPVIGLPAALVARHARAEVLSRVARPEEAAREASVALADLASGRWTLTSGQFDHYADDLARLGGTGGPAAADVAVAAAVADRWRSWPAASSFSGRKLVRPLDVPLVVVWRGAPERLSVWLARPDALLQHMPSESGTRVAMADAEGFIIAGASSRTAEPVVRTSADTRLPWTVFVDGDRSPGAALGGGRRPFVIGGLLVMLGFLAAGSYFIGRAVKQEMDLARLQADFVSAVSHEFRTPLAAMRQLSELLAAGRVPVEARRQQYYESLAGESRRLQRLVENVLNVGRLEAGVRPYQLEPLDPRALVEAVVADFASQLARPDCRIEVAGSDDVARLLGDRDAVALALHNLIDNAVKYSGPGRTVHVEWGRQDDRVAIRVRDEGPGIAAGERDRIFRKFVRGAAAAAANVRGTGVGLAMVQLVVAGHGGEVVVDSQPGAGATFTMLFPSAAPA
jgi:signal transduction histidine kinase